MLAAGSAFGLMGAMIKLVGKRLNVFEVVFLRCLFLSMPLGCYYLLAHKRPRVGNKRLMLTRCLLGCAAMCLFFWTIVRLDLATAMVLNKMSPVWVVVFAVLLLREEVSRAVPPLVLVAFAGCFLLIQPDLGSATRSPLVGVAGLVSGLLGGLAYICVRELRNTEETADIVLCFTLFSALACLPGVLADFVWPSRTEWLALAGAGLCAATGQCCMTASYRVERAAIVAPFFYSSVLVATLVGYLFWDEKLTALSTAGVGLVVAAGALICALRR